MKKVLITGASGFIGAKLFQFFQKKQYIVYGWDREQTEKVCKVDMLDSAAVTSELRNTVPDIIIHTAGSADVGKSVQAPDMDFAGNVTITHNLLFTLHKLHMEKVRVVFLSSAGVYGNPVSLPITENMPLNPLSPYALHKVMCEDMCRYFSNNYNMNIKIARIFSAYGAGLKKQIFWDMHMKAASTGKLEMLGTGSESRDYIHVNDVVQALFLLATLETQYMIFNVANGEEVTIRQAAEWFAKSIGMREDKISFSGVAREGDPINWLADNTRIRELGYHKTVEMQEGLRKYIEWIRNNTNTEKK